MSYEVFSHLLINNFIAFAIFLGFSTLVFYCTAYLLEIKNNSLGKSFVVAVVGAVLVLLRELFFPFDSVFSWLLFAFIFLYSVKSTYKVGWFLSIVVWFISSFLSVIFLFVLKSIF